MLNWCILFQDFCIVKAYYTSVLPLKLSSAQGKYIFISLFKPSEHYLNVILFHFAIRIRWANFEREDYKNIKELQMYMRGQPKAGR